MRNLKCTREEFHDTVRELATCLDTAQNLSAVLEIVYYAGSLIHGNTVLAEQATEKAEKMINEGFAPECIRTASTSKECHILSLWFDRHPELLDAAITKMHSLQQAEFKNPKSISEAKDFFGNMERILTTGDKAAEKNFVGILAKESERAIISEDLEDWPAASGMVC